MKKILNPFEELLVLLVEEGVQFITVGGIACAFNGYVRTTEDVDLLVKRDPANVQKLLNFLAHYGQGFGKELNEADFSDEEGAIRVIEEFPIDLFVVMSGKHFEDFEKSIQWVEIHGCQIPFLSKEALIELKKGSLREKDRIDVLNLQQISKTSS